MVFRLEPMPKVSLYKIAHVIQGKTMLQAAGEGHAGGANFTFDGEPRDRAGYANTSHFVTAAGGLFFLFLKKLIVAPAPLFPVAGLAILPSGLVVFSGVCRPRILGLFFPGGNIFI